MKIRSLLRLASAILIIAAAAPPLAAATEGPKKTLPIMTWLGPGKDLLRPDVFKKVAEAGFSVNMSFLGDRESNLKALDLAREAGLTLMIHDDRVAKLVEDASLPLAPLDQVVADYKNHPALFGYYILDEPNASKFPRLGEIVRYLEAKDPLHPAYINLFPTYANSQQLGTETYEQHVAAYMKTVRPTFLSYDHYPITDKGLRPDYYRNLEVIRAAAGGGQRPLLGVHPERSTRRLPAADFGPPAAAIVQRHRLRRRRTSVLHLCHADRKRLRLETGADRRPGPSHAVP